MRYVQHLWNRLSHLWLISQSTFSKVLFPTFCQNTLTILNGPHRLSEDFGIKCSIGKAFVTLFAFYFRVAVDINQYLTKLWAKLRDLNIVIGHMFYRLTSWLQNIATSITSSYILTLLGILDFPNKFFQTGTNASFQWTGFYFRSRSTSLIYASGFMPAHRIQ